jgi:hypothetical protein
MIYACTLKPFISGHPKLICSYFTGFTLPFFDDNDDYDEVVLIGYIFGR